MDISNNYFKSIASNQHLYSTNNAKDVLSGAGEYAISGAENEKNGDNKLSATARFLNKPIISVLAEPNKLPHLLKSGQNSAFSSELGAIKARVTLVGREVASRMDVLRSGGAPKMAASLPLPADQRTPAGPAIDMNVFLQNLGLLSPDVQLDGAEQANSLFDALKNATGGGGGPSSSWNICESVANAIGGMGSDYLDVFQQAVEKYADFYRDFSDFISKLKDYMQASSMGGDGSMILEGDKFLADLQKLIDKYTSGNNAKLYPANDGGASKEESEAWCREMGFDPEKCLRRLSDGSYEVRIDTSPLQEIYDSVTLNFPYIIEGEGGGSSGLGMLCNSAQWAAWQAGLDMQKDNIQTGMQTLTQKYSNANSTYDNLVKVLSSTITSLLDCDKGFLNI